MREKLRKITSVFTAFLMVLTMFNYDLKESYAAEDVTIQDFDYIQTNDKNGTSVQVIIKGDNFIQEINGKSEPVISDILVKGSSNWISLLKGEPKRQGVKVDITDSLITITAPKTGDFVNLNIKTNGESDIEIKTERGFTITNGKFNVNVNGIPTMPGSLKNKKVYVGEEIEIDGQNFLGTTDVVISGASHESGSSGVKIEDTKITIEKLGKGTIGKVGSIDFVKKDDKSNGGPTGKGPKIRFTARYTDKVFVFEKLPGMDNLRVLPKEGPYNTPSKITVQALDKDGKKMLEGVFKKGYKLILRREGQDARGNVKEHVIPLTDVKLVYKTPGDESTPVVGIEGWTPAGKHPINAPYDVVVQDPGNLNSEGIARSAYTFITSNPAPQISGIVPSEGPDTGGTGVLITGKNFLTVNTPGIKIPDNEKVVPSKDANAENTTTLNIDYTVPQGVTYGDQKVKEINREIKVRIASLTNAKAGKIHQLSNPPKPGDTQGGKKYGEFHFMANGTDGVVFTTTNAATSGPQTVIMDVETTFTFEDGTKVTIPEGAKYNSFTYNEKNPTPRVESVELEYGFFNDSEEEEENPTGSVDGIKPLMIRIKGQKFEAIKDGNKMKYPNVQFVLPDLTVQPVISSEDIGDTKVLDDKGNPIDGIYNKTGTTLVLSIIPKKNDKYGLRRLVGQQQEQTGNYKNLDLIAQVTNPSGNSSSPTADSPKFQFRRPSEGNYEDVNSKQPVITNVTRGETPVTKLPSDEDADVKIRLKSVAGISDMNKLKVTVDGKDISNNIKEVKLEGDEVVMDVTIPKGFVGSTRLQVIIPEGLMDSKKIIFDTIRGPEIKELIPNAGEKGTIVVIKRDTQANAVGFKTPLPDSDKETERIGSKVLWNGTDINELFGGYEKDSNGKVIYKESEKFKEFKQQDKDKKVPFSKIPGKYVYVVDSDTIYLWIPEENNLDDGIYNIQVRNPDGAESSKAEKFTLLSTPSKTKIGSIAPDTDDKNGGIIAKITSGGNTNFKGGVDVWFGSEKAEVVAYDIDNKFCYVKVPPLKDFTFPSTTQDSVEAFTVPVTVQNKVNKSSDTINDGFKYLNPVYDMKITQVYNEKYSADPTKGQATGVEDEYLIIRGENFRVMYEKDDREKRENPILPKVMFGYELAEKPVAFGPVNVDKDGKPILDEHGRAELEWIKVKIPKRPTLGVTTDGKVDLLVQNPDGAKAIKKDGFQYITSKPEIIEQSSLLQASRFFDTISVDVRNINPNGVLAAFGNKVYEKELSATPMQLETTEEVEKLVFKYTPGSGDNMEVFYKKSDGSLIPMTDAVGTNNGKFRLGKVGEQKIIGINWKNKDYHTTGVKDNPDLINNLNYEYVLLKVENKAPNINTLYVRRGLGEVTKAVRDEKTDITKLTIETPYWEKIEDTTITIINQDGSSDDAPFKFHGGIEFPVITDIEGSKERDLTIEGTPVKAKVYTTDYTEPDEIIIRGLNFKDIQKVLVGEYPVEVLNVSQDYTSMKVRVPAGKLEDVGKPLPISIVTKEGNAVSSNSVPPVYFMFIQTGSKPEILRVVPKKGPQTGGTKILIEGRNFREMDEFGVKGNIEVLVGGVKTTVDRTIRNDKGEIVGLEVTAPSVGVLEEKSTLQVKNADGGRGKPSEFRYISQPLIERIEGQATFNAEEDPDGNKVQIRVYGKNFYNPDYVILGGEVKDIPKNLDDVDNSLLRGVKKDGSNQYVEFAKNKDGTIKGMKMPVEAPTEANLPPNNNPNSPWDYFTVTIPSITPEEMDNIKTKNIIVVNKDGGVSYESPVDMKMPVPEAPAVIATPGYGNTINISWHLKEKDLNKADRFEIYIKKQGQGNDYVHVGDVAKNQDGSLDYSYVIKNTEPNTDYQIKVRVMNKYGEAEDFGYANIKTLAKADDYKSKEKEKELNRSKDKIRQKGTKKVVGDSLEYTVGTLENNISLAGYPKVKKKKVRVPVAQIKLAPNTTITLNDNDMTLVVPFKAFELPQVQQVSDDSVVQITIENTDGKNDQKVSSILRKTRSKRLTRVHGIRLDLVEPKRTTVISKTKTPLTLTLYSNKQNIGNLAEYIPNKNRVNKNINPNISKGGYYVQSSK